MENTCKCLRTATSLLVHRLKERLYYMILSCVPLFFHCETRERVRERTKRKQQKEIRGRRGSNA